MSNAAHFHALAKGAGNRLRAYILNTSSAALGVYFLALTTATGGHGTMEKLMLMLGMVAFALTTLLRLLEMHVDARRFFAVAKEMEKPEEEQFWLSGTQYEQQRLLLIWASYWTFGAGVVAFLFYLLIRVVG